MLLLFRDFARSRSDVTKPAAVLSLAVDLCQAMCVLHDANLVHRDIAARNGEFISSHCSRSHPPLSVLLDDEWRPVLTDFGLSRTASSNAGSVS